MCMWVAWRVQKFTLKTLFFADNIQPLAKLVELMARGCTALLDRKWAELMAIEFMTAQVIK